MDKNTCPVITISREVGSGGRSIGRKLAARLGVRFCDKQLVQALEEKFDLTVAEIERLKAQKRNWLADFLDKVTPMPGSDLMIGPRPAFSQGPLLNRTTTEDIFKAESEILHAIAEEGPCVIAGRSGFFVLRDLPDRIDILIRASRGQRIARVMRRQGISREEAEAILDQVDEGRENYVSRFAGTSRYDARNYDLVLNVDGLDEDAATDLIMDFVNHRRNAQ